MKKRPVLAPVLLISAITAALFVCLCLPLGQATRYARGGELDLRGETYAGPFRLAGEWQYTPGLLLMPGEFPDNAPVINMPDTRLGIGGDTGCATYRLVVIHGARPFTMFVPAINTAYRLWVNGEFIRGAGVVSDRRERGEPASECVLVPVRTEGSRVEIVIQASDYVSVRPHMSNALLFGGDDAVRSWFYRTRLLYMTTAGVVLAASFFYITMFFARRGQKTYLVFSLYCLVCFINLIAETNGAADMAGAFAAGAGRIGVSLRPALFFLHGAFFALVMLYVFDEAWINKKIKITAVCCAAGALLFAAAPMNFPQAAGFFYITAAALPAFAVYKSVRSGGFKRNKILALYLAAAGLYAAFGFLTKFFLSDLLFMAPAVPVIFLVMVQCFTFARTFADTLSDERRFALKADMINRLGHDLRTPLTRISTNIQMAKILPEESEEYLSNTQADVMQMAEIINEAFSDGGNV